MPDGELAAYLEKNKLDPIRAQELPRLAWAEDKPKAEHGVAAYLKVSFLGCLFYSLILYHSTYVVFLTLFFFFFCDSDIRNDRHLLRRIPLKALRMAIIWTDRSTRKSSWRHNISFRRGIRKFALDDIFHKIFQGQLSDASFENILFLMFHATPMHIRPQGPQTPSSTEIFPPPSHLIYDGDD